MLKNYLTVALRGFWRNKVFSLIHVLGLSIGISASVVIYLIAHYELSFDKFEPDGHRVYRVVMDFNFNGGDTGHSGAVPAPLAGAMQAEITGVDAVIPIMQFPGDATVTVTIPIRQAGQSTTFKKQTSVVFTTGGYFEMIPRQWLAGSPQTALTEPFSVVLTESRALKYFPGITIDKIIGQQIVYNDNIQTTVTGIVKDLDEPTDFTAQELIAHATIAKTEMHSNFMMDVWDDWMAYSQTYVKLTPANDKAGIETQLNALFRKYNKKANKENNYTAFLLQPLSDIHFNANYAGFGQHVAHKNTLYGLLAIATFLLLLGCINFTNLATAQAGHRAKEIGIRKTIGSSKKQLVTQFLSETFCITAVATLLSVCISPVLLEMFADFIPPGVSFEIIREPSVIVFLVALTIVVSLLSGLYPALVLSGFRPVSVLKNRGIGGSSTRSAGIRKILTVSQFIIAQFFVIAAFMVSKQIHFSLHQDLGYRKEAILNFEIPGRDTLASHRHRLVNEITAMPEVQMVSTGFLPPAVGGAAFGNISYHNGKEEVKINVQIRWGEPDYIRLYKIKIVAGRNVRAGDNINEILINESYARALGFTDPQDALHKELTMGNGSKIPIVGIMHDFHEGSFHGHIGPLVFRSSNTGFFFHIALLPQDAEGKQWQRAIEKIQKVYHEIYPENDFDYHFFDDSIAGFYVREQNTARLLNWATGLSIFISCLGLLGLVIYTAETRTKEIGIRKILGASVTSIVSILSLEFIRLVLIAFAIAAPVAWWAITQWLQNFAYRTTISWWVFALSGLFLIIASIVTLSTQIIKTATTNPVKSLRTE